MVEGRNVFEIVTDKPTGRRSLKMPRRRSEDMDIKETGVNARNWIDSG